MTRKDILAKADACVNGERNDAYGSPEDNFATIARFWNDYLDRICRPLLPHDVAAMMGLLKIARIAGGDYSEDSWVDLAGYSACGGELQESSKGMSISITDKTAACLAEQKG